MKHLFVINPVAGKTDCTQEILRRLEPYRADYDMEIAVTSKPREALDFVADASQRCDQLRVYACGGDGTFNEVASAAVELGNVAVTHYPFGSGNDYIKIFSDRGESFRNIDNLLNDSEEAYFDVIRCNDRVGANICSVGIDARIGTEIQKYKRWPLVSGKMAYYISTLVNVIKGIDEHYVVEVNGQRIDSRFTLICVSNGRCYGGSFNPTPDAEPDDGLLDVLLVKPVSRLKAAALIGRYANGEYKQMTDLITHYRCTDITISADEDMAVNIDGELMVTRRAHMSVQPHALRVFYPRGIGWSSECWGESEAMTRINEQKSLNTRNANKKFDPAGDSSESA